jgi:GAF domain-containing protein
LRESVLTDDDTETLTQIANQVAIAVESAMRFEEVSAAQEQIRISRDRLRLLLKVNNALVAQLDLHDLLKAISSILKEVIHQDFPAWQSMIPILNSGMLTRWTFRRLMNSSKRALRFL